jgi:predicted anti-sigma-YlaC factor YlaD
MRLPDVNCDVAREAISALLDGERPDVDLATLDEHLGGCPTCQKWQEQAHELTRRARLQSARPAPIPTERILAVAGVRHLDRWRRPDSAAAVRFGLVVVAGVQLAVCVPVLLFGHDRSAPLHVAHEMGSFEVAIAVGLLVAAYRPTRAAGMVSLVGAAATLLVVTAALDLAANRTDLSDEAPHLIVVVGWLLLWRLAAVTPPSWERPRSALTAISGMWEGVTHRRGAAVSLDVSDSAEPGRGVASVPATGEVTRPSQAASQNGSEEAVG